MVKVGDIVWISQPGHIPTEYTIRLIKDNVAYISTKHEPDVYSAIKWNDKTISWSVSNNTENVNYQIQFQTIGLTMIEEIDLTILNKLTLSELVNLLNVNTYFRKLSLIIIKKRFNKHVKGSFDYWRSFIPIDEYYQQVSSIKDPEINIKMDLVISNIARESKNKYYLTSIIQLINTSKYSSKPSDAGNMYLFFYLWDTAGLDESDISDNINILQLKDWYTGNPNIIGGFFVDLIVENKYIIKYFLIHNKLSTYTKNILLSEYISTEKNNNDIIRSILSTMEPTQISYDLKDDSLYNNYFNKILIETLYEWKLYNLNYLYRAISYSYNETESPSARFFLNKGMEPSKVKLAYYKVKMYKIRDLKIEKILSSLIEKYNI